MPTMETLIAFAIVSAGLMVLPGPSNFFILAHGIGHGHRAALAAAMGIAAASAIRVLLTAAGLSALLASSAVAFNAIRWAGVAYLLYLGVTAWRSCHDGLNVESSERVLSKRHSARKGLLVGLGNPKMVLFFVAFFPQFIDPAQGSAVIQMLVLGTIFWVIGTSGISAARSRPGRSGDGYDAVLAFRRFGVAPKARRTSAWPPGPHFRTVARVTSEYRTTWRRAQSCSIVAWARSKRAAIRSSVGSST